MTIALVILLVIGSVAFIRAMIVGESPLTWIAGLVQGGAAE